MTKLQQGNKIVIKMLNKHENPSETSKSKRQKQKQNCLKESNMTHSYKITCSSHVWFQRRF
jgi:RNA polymerase-interacting CarD/CdnL/TRCF family regulator